MRVIWLIGGTEANRASFEAAFARPTLHSVAYLVRQAEGFDQIPPEHLNQPGVVVFLDSFHPRFPGFEGLRELRHRGFNGPCFLFGEPAPESALEPFKSLSLTGYFPPFERADFDYAAGLVHYHMNFNGEIELSSFLSGNGKASSETIRNLRDFNLFTQKLSTFVARFGVDGNQLRKILMGLSLAHVKTGGGSATIEQPFNIHFGMDPNKIVLAAPAFSKGASSRTILEEFCSALGNLKSTPSLKSSIFPEIHHVSRATENLVIFAGSSKVAGDAMDPMVLMTTLSFPSPKNPLNVPMLSFSFAHVRPTDEMSEAVARLVVEVPTEAAPNPETSGESETGSPTSEAPSADETPASDTVVASVSATNDGTEGVSDPNAAGPEGTLEAVDISKILSEPEVVGDAPRQVDTGTSVPSESDGGVLPSDGTEGAKILTPELQAEMEASAAEMVRLRELTQIMGHDIRRLMKERRQPTTDRELRDANQNLEAKIKLINAERAKLFMEIDKRDKQIEELRAALQQLRAKAA